MTTILSPNHSIISPANSVSSTSSSRTNDSGISITNGKLTASQKQYAETCSFPFCDDVKKYRKIAKIGHGTYGEVFKACNPSNNQFVALKSINNNNNKAIGFPMLSIREISILKRIKHENVVNLIEVCRSTRTGSGRDHTNFYLVLEFCEHDLAGILANTNVQLNSGEIKNLLKQLFNGIEFIHSHRIFHRDLKPSNILVTKNGVIKLTDFGLARQFNLSYDQYRPVTPSNSLVTLWYRPPELLLGDQNYGPSIDMWSLGLIMAEMWFRAPIIQGKSEQEQIYLIIQLCGSIKPTVSTNAVLCTMKCDQMMTIDLFIFLSSHRFGQM